MFAALNGLRCECCREQNANLEHTGRDFTGGWRGRLLVAGANGTLRLALDFTRFDVAEAAAAERHPGLRRSQAVRMHKMRVLLLSEIHKPCRSRRQSKTSRTELEQRLENFGQHLPLGRGRPTDPNRTELAASAGGVLILCPPQSVGGNGKPCVSPRGLSGDCSVYSRAGGTVKNDIN